MLFVALILIIGLIRRDVNARAGFSPGLWLPLFWVVLISSRPVSSWFQTGMAADGAGTYDEGNPFERNVYLIFLVLGLVTLGRRGVRLQEVLRQNKWLSIFFIYWLLSCLWAELPFVAFKRWIKDAGNILMALVILTEHDPAEAAKAVFVRCAILLLPLSIVFIRYYPEFGRAYDVGGNAMFTGVATHKNTLGVLAAVCSLVLMWEFLDVWKASKSFRSTLWRLDTSLLMVGLWLLAKSKSATSQACTVIGAVVIWGLRLPTVRARVNQLGLYAAALAALFWVLNSVFDLYRFIVVNVLGRDLGLTTRTEIWPILLNHVDNPLFGAGFRSYWSGERLKVLLPKYGIIQAHSGYIELYLNGGFVALFFYLVLVVTSFKSMTQRLAAGDDFAVIKIAFLVISLFYNYSEASISSISIMWFVTLLAITKYEMVSEAGAFGFGHGAGWSRNQMPDAGWPRSATWRGEAGPAAEWGNRA